MKFGSKGWQHRAWVDSFYPDDLPPEWRLPYYSNEFHAVLIPSNEIKNSHPDQIQEWLDDCTDNFSFFVEIDVKQEFSMQLQKAQILLPQLAGIMLDKPVEESGYSSANIGIMAQNTLGQQVHVYAPEINRHAKIADLGAQLFNNILPPPQVARPCVALLTSNTLSMVALKELLAVLHSSNGGCAAFFLAGSTPNLELLRQASNIYNLSY